MIKSLNGYGDFSQSELLKYLADPNHKAECTQCHKTALQIQLELHHINHKKEDTTYENLEILCIDCHRKREGRDTKLKDIT